RHLPTYEKIIRNLVSFYYKRGYYSVEKECIFLQKNKKQKIPLFQQMNTLKSLILCGFQGI
ncbi:MAG: hypothetical protein ACLSA7_07785, partial [Anaerostipes hadrus]